MAKRPRDETSGGDQLVLKLVPANSLKTWLNAKAKLKETKDQLATNMREHTEEVVKKGLNKDVGNLLVKLAGYTPEKLQIWKAHFDDCWVKAGFEDKIENAANVAAAAAQEGDGEGDDDADAPKKKKGTRGRRARPSDAPTGNVTQFPMAAE